MCAMQGPELATPNDDQVWQDEELARAMQVLPAAPCMLCFDAHSGTTLWIDFTQCVQASLDAEAGRSVGLPWLTAPRDGNEGDSPSSAWPSVSPSGYALPLLLPADHPYVV